LEIGAFQQVMLREQRLMNEYNMTESEIEKAVYEEA
jgi:hypothetical protein